MTSFTSSSLQKLTTQSPILLVLVISLIFGSIFQLIFRRTKKLDFPVVGNARDLDFRNAMKEGVARYPDCPFVIPSNPPTIVLPKISINDVKGFPESKASFNEHVSREFHPQVTGLGASDVSREFVAKDLTRFVGAALHVLQDETTYAFNKELGSCEEWTPFVLYSFTARVVALLSGRVFVGLPLSRNEEWVNTSVDFTSYVMKFRDASQKLPLLLQNLVLPYIRETRQLKQLQQRAATLLRPTLDIEREHNDGEKTLGLENSSLKWLISRMDPRHRDDPLSISMLQLELSFAAIHTSSITLTNAIFDLAAYPEYIPILREEIQAVMKEDGYDQANDGTCKLRKPSIPRLAKLDSFLKESQRVNPLAISSHTRITTSDVKLSTGHVVPKNTRISIPSWVIHNESEALRSVEHTKPLNEFDGLRFYNLRHIPGNENRHLFVSTSPDSLSFGYGNHACPGRFFASNEIKVILIEVLTHWDLRLPNDAKVEGGAWRRPKNFYKEYLCFPDISAKIEMRRRRQS
ncbi:BgTH12-01720 [Blumeria graminis f. sp. triticale]|uniref:Bgt-5126 n=3 Tax=Blumeria graminis TaxID=34373 RepID=A0A061HFF0_BLUGR|nr:hypothetical protein BGT96224_5126 [Blumeria graminis f. sp. tritici 96224]CAD6501468.1 BgTH12-01720 [Blumeria graminis f. sp. triticale]VDB83976.1 Bgt-5126 [Blumeria graminis f. sp. tritici]